MQAYQAEQRGDDCANPVPFQLRSQETDRIHRLNAVTRIGRSTQQMNPDVDLVIGRHSQDVSRVHAEISVFRDDDDPNIWVVRICSFGTNGGSGPGNNMGGGHGGGGTSVDEVLVPPGQGRGMIVEPGSFIRFGLNEIWVLERANLFPKSELADAAKQRSVKLSQENPVAMRELKVPSSMCYYALQDCEDWASIVSIVLEWLEEPDEAPCADQITILDELGGPGQTHQAATLDIMMKYDISKILCDIRQGCSVRLKLSSDPYLLGPLIMHLERNRLADEEAEKERPAMR